MISKLQLWWQWLTTDPLGFIIFMVYMAAAILITLILHEMAHAYAAYRCGDPTAKMLGRLTFNPKKHLDPFGTICLLLFGFGWAKPVPINPRNFKNLRRDDFIVSVAGITANLTLYLLSSALMVGISSLLWRPEVILANGGDYAFLSSGGIGYSILISGSGGDFIQYMQRPWLIYIQRFLMLFASFNLGVGIFNLLPVPPLDGYHIFNDLIFKGKLKFNTSLHQLSSIIMLMLFFSGILGNILGFVTGTIESGVLNLFLQITGKI